MIGSGIAGLSYALSVADTGKVAIVTKDRAQEGSTRYAQVLCRPCSPTPQPMPMSTRHLRLDGSAGLTVALR